MINPWDSGSRTYRTTLLTGTGLLGLGILLAVIGAAAGNVLPLQWTAIGLLAAGLLTHVAAQLIRARDARRRHGGKGTGQAR